MITYNPNTHEIRPSYAMDRRKVVFWFIRPIDWRSEDGYHKVTLTREKPIPVTHVEITIRLVNDSEND